MSFVSRFFGGDLHAKQELTASYLDALPVESPWADNSHLETLTLASLYGLDAENLPVTRDSALRIAALSKGRNLICTSIARLPLTAVKNGQPLAVQPALLRQLSPGTTNFQVLSYVVDGMLFYGRAFLLITARTSDGRPSSVQFVPEGKAEVNDSGQLTKAFDRPVKAADVIRIDANHTGILASGRDVLRTAAEIERVSAEAGASPVPSIILKQKEGTDLTKEEVTGLLAQWSANRRKKYGSVAFANKALDIEAIGQSAENLLIEGMNHSVLQIARLLGLPAWSLDGTVAGSSLSYSNMASRNRELLESVAPYIEAIQQTLALFLPLGTEVVLDTTELLRPDTQGRYQEYETALRAGFLTVEEVRAKENLAPLPAEKSELSAADEAAKITSLGVLVRSGFDPEEAAKALGLPPYAHLGLLPVTVQAPAETTTDTAPDPADSLPAAGQTNPETETEATND